MARNDYRPGESSGMSLPFAILGMALTGVLGFFLGNMSSGPAANNQGAQVADAGTPNSKGGAAAAGQVYDIKVGESPAKGAAGAKVTIITFSDFQCPFCKKSEPIMASIQQKYGNDVRIVWKDMPLKTIHPNAMAAAIAARAAGKQGADKFWAMHDVLFEGNSEFSGKDNLWTPDRFESFASKVQGLDVARWKADIADPAVAASIEEDIKTATNFGVTGTPAFFINGEFMKNSSDPNKFFEVIDRQKTRAEGVLAKGISPERLYAELTKDGLKKAAPKQGPSQADPNAVYKVPAPDDSPWKGNKDAKITIVEFSDFQCPFCSKVEIPKPDQQGVVQVPVMKQVMDTYPGQVKIVFRHNPLSSIHPDAQLAAEASMAAHEQGKFWEYHTKLFENQRALKRENLESYAQELGLDMAKFKAALDTSKFKAKVLADQAESQKFGSNSTPGFFINGRFIKGAAAFAQFQKVIDEEMKKADALLAQGVPANQLYNKLIEKGLDRAAAAPSRPRQDPNAVYKIPVEALDPVKGASDALVTIVEFSDFQCPYCARVAAPYVDPRTQAEVKPALPDVLAKYNGKVRFVFKQFPLTGKHPDAHLASQAALAANEQGKFWEFHDLMFKNQKALKRADLESYAQQLSLDMVKFKAALDTGKFSAKVDADMKLGQQVGVPGTPTFYVNGKSFSQAPTLDGFSTAIEAALKEAEAIKATGVAPKDVYAKIIEKGATAPVFLPATPAPGAAPAAAPGAPGGPNVIQLPVVQPGQPIVIQGGGGKPPVVTTPGAAPVAPGAPKAPAPVTPKVPAPAPAPK